MNIKRAHMMVAGVLAIMGLMMCPANLSAQESDEDPPPRRERGPRQSPERIQQHIDELIEEGVPEDDPRVRRLRRMLEWIEQGGGPRPDGRGRPRGRGPGHPGADRGGMEEMMEFVRQHPELEKLMMKSHDGREASPKAMQRNVRRSAHQISEIMAAASAGNPDLADALIESAKVHLTVRERARRYHRAQPDSPDRAVIRDELDVLVREQVEIDLEVQELKLVSLRQRLGKQEARLAKDRQRQDELAAKKLERILSGKRKHSGRRDRPGPPGRQGRPQGSDDDL